MVFHFLYDFVLLPTAFPYSPFSANQMRPHLLISSFFDTDNFLAAEQRFYMIEHVNL